MRARAFFDLVVEPSSREFLGDPRSPRKAILAALMVYHFPEHVFAERYAEATQVTRALSSYRAGYSNKPWFCALDQVANAAKHGRRRNGYDLTRLWDAPPSIVGKMILGRSFLGDKTGGVVARLQAGKGPVIKLDKAVEAALSQYRQDFIEITNDGQAASSKSEVGE